MAVDGVEYTAFEIFERSVTMGKHDVYWLTSPACTFIGLVHFVGLCGRMIGRQEAAACNAPAISKAVCIAVNSVIWLHHRTLAAVRHLKFTFCMYMV